MMSLEKKRKTSTTTKTKDSTIRSTAVPSLPDDLLLSLFARVSRLYYPTLSLVSKRFRSLLASPDLYKDRSLLSNNEICLYVCLSVSGVNLWYTLCRKPDQNLTKDSESSSGYVLALVPIPDSPPAHFSNLVAVGSSIYNIGGAEPFCRKPYTSVWILDCVSHTWREAPSLRVKQSSLSASVLDKKIYVAGRNDKYFGPGSKILLEVFDTETQTWNLERFPYMQTQNYLKSSKSGFIDGKFHFKSDTGLFAYDSKKRRWDIVHWLVGAYMFTDSYCEIDNVIYAFYCGRLRWYDTDVSIWRDVKGLIGKLDSPPDGRVRLVDYGGKMAVLSLSERLYYENEKVGFYNKTKISCGVIALEKPTSSEIRGKVEWFDNNMLIVPTSSELVKVLAVSV